MESKEAQKERTKKIIAILKGEFPDSGTALNYSDPLELLIATILSAQCTDERVNKVTVELFKKYKTAQDYADVEVLELEREIHPTGFFRNKTKSIKLCCGAIVERHNGQVPSTMEELTKLGGVGRKTANVVLGNVFGIPGVVVDTHVKRISQRLAITENQNPDKIEGDLMKIVPKEEWTLFSHLLIDHGRKTCQARSPKCRECNIAELCPSRQY